MKKLTVEVDECATGCGKPAAPNHELCQICMGEFIGSDDYRTYSRAFTEVLKRWVERKRRAS